MQNQLEKLQQIRENNETDTVTYNFADGTKVVQPINLKIFTNDKGRKLSLTEVMNIFITTGIDKKATSFTLLDIDDSIKNESEIHFTKDEKKVAKRDYNEFRSMNPEGFRKELRQFRAEIMDKLSKRIRMNIKNVQFLN